MAEPSDTEQRLSGLEARLGYAFREQELLKIAVTAPSYRTDHSASSVRDNQRLEFLGDAVFGLLSAQRLYARFADADEGTLTVRRSLLASGRALAGVARRIGLGGYLRLGRGDAAAGGRENDNTLADAMEAVFGAAWCDGGRAAAEQVYASVMAGCEDVPLDTWSINPKGRLLEVSQRHAWPDSPAYALLDASGPPHAPVYTVSVSVHGGHAARGTGRTKQAAEKAAASALLQQLADAGVPLET